jgi:Uma2 family endonuclease
MSIASQPETGKTLTAVDLVEKFGPIPLSRICHYKPPGEATEEDVLWLDDHADKLCELVEGILVEKAMGSYESLLAGEILALLRNYVKPRKLGAVLGADGMLRLWPGQIRIPDVSFISAAKLADNALRKHRVARLAPDLAVEVLSDSNTDKEMEQKLKDYFAAGTQLVWIVDPEAKTLLAHTSPAAGRLYRENEIVPGEPVLPGFELELQSLFQTDFDLS